MTIIKSNEQKQISWISDMLLIILAEKFPYEAGNKVILKGQHVVKAILI